MLQAKIQQILFLGNPMQKLQIIIFDHLLQFLAAISQFYCEFYKQILDITLQSPQSESNVKQAKENLALVYSQAQNNDRSNRYCIQNNPEVISFSEDGKQVLIHSYDKFVNLLLPWYFRHRNWKSFVRQMNMYNFKKLNRGLKSYIFINEYFSLDNPQQHYLIQRKQSIRSDNEQDNVNLINYMGNSLQKEYSCISLRKFFKAIKQFQLQAENACVEIKSTLETITLYKKNQNNKYIFNRVKDLVQVINESSRKMEQNIDKQKQFLGEGSINLEQPQNELPFAQQQIFEMNESQIKPIKNPSLTNIFVPKPISFSSTDNFLPLEKQNIDLHQTNQKQKGDSSENKLTITPLCSFNSVTHLIDL